MTQQAQVMARLFFALSKLLLVSLAVWGVARLDGAWERPEAGALEPQVTAATATVVIPKVRPPLDPVERPFEGFVLPELWRDSIVRVATAQVGKRYRFGGTTPNRGFDCSGLVRYVLDNVHIATPRTAYLQARVGAPVEPERLEPGDLVSFGPDSVSHIGIYIGDGKFVHASSVAGRVVISRLNRQPSKLIKPLYGARRLLALAETPFYASVVQTASR